MVCDGEGFVIIADTMGLNPCFNGIWSATIGENLRTMEEFGLNPCFNGIWSATVSDAIDGKTYVSLNPCFNGIWSATAPTIRLCV